MPADDDVFDPGPLAWPSDRAWLDPPLVGRQLYTRITDLTLGEAQVLLAAPANPYRWAIMFVRSSSPPSSLLIAPWSDFPNTYLFEGGSGNSPLYRLAEYGSLVMDAWYASLGGPGSFRVVEVIRRTEG